MVCGSQFLTFHVGVALLDQHLGEGQMGAVEACLYVEKGLQGLSFLPVQPGVEDLGDRRAKRSSQ
jgi:hypothetical protein